MLLIGALCALMLSLGTIRADTMVALPFANQSGSANLDWIGESIAERTRDALVSRGLIVLDRTERLEAYRRLGLRQRAPLTHATAIKIGESLDADQVLSGEFQFAGNTLKITARLTDLKRLRQGPEFTEMGALEDLAALETHLAWQTLQFVAPKLAPSETEFRQEQSPIRLDAAEHYIRGLLAASLEQKQRLFLEAARLDARFSQPCFQLGLIHYQRKDYKSAVAWLEKVSPAGGRYREANFLLGLAKYQAGDFAGAQKAFQTVVQVVPLNEVYNNLGAAQSRRNLPEALENFRRALEGDPSDPVYHFNTGYALYKRGDLAAAADQFRAVLDRDPQDAMATLMLGRCLKRPAVRTTQPLERLKTNFEERAYWQLKAMVEAKP